MPRNNRFQVAVLDERQKFVRYIKPADAQTLLTRKTYIVHSLAGEKLKRVRSVIPTPPPIWFLISKSGITAPMITYADILLNVGLPPGLHCEFVSDAQIDGARRKIAEFAFRRRARPWSQAMVNHAG